MVLLLLGLVGCGASDWRAELNVMTVPPPERVIVVGAGMSGLSAARVLADGGIDVVVVEARDRLGGRTWTSDVEGVAVDLGGAWIHGPKGSPLSALTEGFGLSYDRDKSYAGGYVVRNSDGTLAKNAQLLAAQAFARRVVNNPPETDMSFADAVELRLEEEGVEPGVQHDAFSFAANIGTIALDYGAPPADISILSIDQEQWFRGGDQVIAGGYVTLVDALADGLDVRLSQPVTAIELVGDGVAVTTGSEVYEGSHVIVTVPLGVLQAGSIAFSPPLPASKTAALDRLGMGNLEKVVLRYDRAWWGDDGSAFMYLDEEIGRFPVCIDFTAHTGEPTLVCITGGQQSRDTRENLTDEEIVAGTLENLGAALDMDAPEPTTAVVTRWHTDPFSLGSYSYVRVGGSLADMDVLAEPIDGRILFAGEHTVSAYYQTVHGALISGLREASRLGADPYVLPGLEE